MNKPKTIFNSTTNNNQVWFDTKNNTLQQYNGSAWMSINDTKYEHRPNDIITFLNEGRIEFNRKSLIDKSIKVSIEEKPFIDEVYFSESPYAIRKGARRSGGTTLMCLLASYYAINGFNCVIVAKQSQMLYFIKQLFSDLKYLDYTKNIDKDKQTIEFHKNNNKINEINFIFNNPIEYALRGRGPLDYVFIDDYFYNMKELKHTIDHLYPRLNKNANHNRKIVVNAVQ